MVQKRKKVKKVRAAKKKAKVVKRLKAKLRAARKPLAARKPAPKAKKVLAPKAAPGSSCSIAPCPAQKPPARRSRRRVSTSVTCSCRSASR